MGQASTALSTVLPGLKSTHIDPNDIMKLNNTPANLAALTPGGAPPSQIDVPTLTKILQAQALKQGMIPSKFYEGK